MYDEFAEKFLAEWILMKTQRVKGECNVIMQIVFKLEIVFMKHSPQPFACPIGWCASSYTSDYSLSWISWPNMKLLSIIILGDILFTCFQWLNLQRATTPNNKINFTR